MTDACTQYRNLIPRALAADVSPEQQRDLDLHLAECRPCEREQRLYAETVKQLRAAGDEPVPRHFFVYPEEAGLGRRPAFFQMPRVWQAALASALLLLAVISAAALSRLQVRTEDGALTLGFGKLPDRTVPAPQVQAIDARALEGRIMQLVEERRRRDAEEWIQALRAEFTRSSRAAGREYKALLDHALVNLEERMGAAVTAASADLAKRNDQSIDALYQRVSLDRARDLAAVDDRLSLLAASGEVKNTQTDAILRTLLQVAELRLR